jgi:hypothetical protein
MKPSPSQKLVNSAQTSESHEITKVAALKEAQKSRNPRLARAKEKYKSQHERQDGIYPYRLQSTLHE